MTKKQTNQTEQESPQSAPTGTPSSIIEKVKLMGDLSNAVQNEKVVSIIKSLPNGDRIFDLFVSAIEKELNLIMTGRPSDSDSAKQALDLNQSIAAAQQTMLQFRETVMGFLQTPLMQVLNRINQSFGGAPIDNQMHSPPQRNVTESHQPTGGSGRRPVGLGSI